MSELPVPSDYQRLDRNSPFSDLTGPYYAKAGEGTLKMGLRIEEKHSNMLGFAHGGAMMTFADNAITDALAADLDEPVSFVTVTMNTEFLSSARRGDWVESDVTVLRKGGRLMFVDCVLSVEGRPVLHASAVMSRINIKK